VGEVVGGETGVETTGGGEWVGNTGGDGGDVKGESKKLLERVRKTMWEKVGIIRCVDVYYYLQFASPITLLLVLLIASLACLPPSFLPSFLPSFPHHRTPSGLSGAIEDLTVMRDEAEHLYSTRACKETAAVRDAVTSGIQVTLAAKRNPISRGTHNITIEEEEMETA